MPPRRRKRKSGERRPVLGLEFANRKSLTRDSAGFEPLDKFFESDDDDLDIDEEEVQREIAKLKKKRRTVAPDSTTDLPEQPQPQPTPEQQPDSNPRTPERLQSNRTRKSRGSAQPRSGNKSLANNNSQEDAVTPQDKAQDQSATQAQVLTRSQRKSQTETPQTHSGSPRTHSHTASQDLVNSPQVHLTRSPQAHAGSTQTRSQAVSASQTHTDSPQTRSQTLTKSPQTRSQTLTKSPQTRTDSPQTHSRVAFQTLTSSPYDNPAGQSPAPAGSLQPTQLSFSSGVGTPQKKDSSQSKSTRSKTRKKTAQLTEEEQEEQERIVAAAEEKIGSKVKRKRRKKITCPVNRSSSRAGGSGRNRIKIQPRKKVTPGVRRTQRPRIPRVPPGGYIEYKEHFGITPSKTVGAEAQYIVGPIPSPSPKQRLHQKPVVYEEDCYVSLPDPDNPESFINHRILYPLSHAKLTSVTGDQLQAGDDVIVSKVFGNDDCQIGQVELKNSAEKPLARNGKCHMVFFVVKGKITVVIEDSEIQVNSDDYFSIPPGCVYGLVNEQRSSAKLSYHITYM